MRNNKISIFITIIILYILTFFFTYNNNIINILPILSALIYFITEWFGTVFKIVAAITTSLWLIYDISVLSISGIIYNLITISTILYSIKKGNHNSFFLYAHISFNLQTSHNGFLALQ